MASQALLQELRQVIHDDYGQDMSLEQASDVASAIVELFTTVINHEYEK